MVEDDQKQRIKEMNGIMDNMNEDEFKSVFTKELFDSMYKMIEDEKLSMDNAILLLKRVGYCKVLKEACCLGFEESSLDQRFKKMIVVEYEKKEEKDEKLFVDLCECYLMLNDRFDWHWVLGEDRKKTLSE
ncbi:uncharacterized protein MONOS_18141 [Monocercomonoides exilis]|uniref:uncharacterized protein n=1 Tax=Monocercomonoides exilis TaxID=2049356 RepID=UPI00355977C6|nr:hypothetical protein MONOS_18141 [Monocercomonoides exilis]